MALQIAPLIALERRQPVPDGVLFAVARAPQLVVAGNNGTALSYAPLSNFLASMAELQMGRALNRLNRRNVCQTATVNFQKASAPALF